MVVDLVRECRLELIRRAIEEGVVDAGVRLYDGCTPLHVAAAFGAVGCCASSSSSAAWT